MYRVLAPGRLCPGRGADRASPIRRATARCQRASVSDSRMFHLADGGCCLIALSDSDFSVIFQMSQRLLAVSPVPPRRPLCALRAALAVASSHTSHRSPALSHDAAASNEPSSSSICWMPFIWAPRATVFCNCARRCSSASSSVRTRASRSASAATCASCSA